MRKYLETKHTRKIYVPIIYVSLTNSYVKTFFTLHIHISHIENQIPENHKFLYKLYKLSCFSDH